MVEEHSRADYNATSRVFYCRNSLLDFPKRLYFCEMAPRQKTAKPRVKEPPTAKVFFSVLLLELQASRKERTGRYAKN